MSSRLNRAGFSSALRTLLVCVVALTWASARCLGDAGKTLYWAALDVSATLDGDGRLAVTERHEMVFTGDWNGGYRTFRVAPGQRLDVLSLARVDAQTEQDIPLTEGDIDRVDHYERDGYTYRWRSRRPTDPPFAQKHLTYVLTYTLSHILASADDGTFVLDHDCAFPDRTGVIEHVHVSFDLSSQWEALDEFPSSFTRDRLEPGDSLIVHARLRHLGPGLPAAVWMPMSHSARTILIAVVLAGVVMLSVSFLHRESRLGRFNALPSISTIDTPWLEANVLRFLPEQVGAVWNGSVGAPEVAAIIARLVTEGRLTTEVKTERLLFVPVHTLKLRRTNGGERPLLTYERALLQKLFFRGGDETDTAEIRAHYARTGFDPAAYVRTDLEASVRQHAELSDTAALPGTWPIVVSLLAAALLTLHGLAVQPDPFWAGIATLVACGGALLVAGVCAAIWRGSVARPWLSLPFLACVGATPVLALIAVAYSHLLDALLRPDSYYLLGAGMLALATFANTLRVAATRDGPQRLVARQRFAAARRYFVAELRRPAPHLHDAWFPYVIALGLGRVATRWFRRFGAATSSPASRTESHTWTSGGSSTSGTASTGTWTGGSGQFGGAGAGGAWLVALSSVASGVSAPSSSSSSGGGGGGGGGSSGGGGGGGW